MSYSKRAHTFRTTAGDKPAARARLGSPSFIGLNISGSVPAGLIAELTAKRHPSSVEHGFSHPCLGKLGRVHVADDDQFVGTSNPCGLFVKVMATGVGDLCVDRSNPPCVVGSLRYCEGDFVFPIVLQGRNQRSVAARGDGLKSKINPYLAVADRQTVGNFALKRDIPAPTGVLREASCFDLPTEIAGLPEIKMALEIGGTPSIDPDGARDERDPAQSTLWSAAGAKPWVTPFGVPGCGKLATHRLYGITMEAEFSGCACAQLDQVEGTRPFGDSASLPSVLRLPLDLAAVVPDAVHRTGMSVEVFSDSCVLDTVFERQHHARSHTWSNGKMQEHRTGRQVVFNLHVHLVFVTKYRRDALSALAIDDLRSIFSKLCTDFEAELVECDGEDDHVHLLINYPPKIAISKLVNSLKGVSSRMLRQIRPEVRGRYRKGVLWSPSYFAASCGGAPLSVIAEYVSNQRKGRASSPA